MNDTDQAIKRIDEARQARWKDQLIVNKKGDYYANELNCIRALQYCPALAGKFRYNAFADRLLIVGSVPWREISEPSDWTDADRVELMAFLQDQGLMVNRPNVIQDAVTTVSQRDPMNPVVEYLDSLEWDQTYRLATWLQEYLGAKGSEKYLDAVGPRILVGGVARAYEPGCKVDTVPVLEGPQGIGKSTAIRILGQPWNADGVPDLSTKDAAIQIQGVWIVELEELTSMTRADIEHVKAFLSRSTDRYRPPYGRNAINRPRRCIFIASTNLQDYLKDESGNRRFWPVRCRDIQLDALERDRNQLWAEARHLHESGFQWHLSRDDELLAEQEQELRRLVPELEADLLDYLDARREAGAETVYMRDLLEQVAGIKDFAKERYHAGAIGTQFSRVLTRNGWEKLRPFGRGNNRKQPFKFQPKD